MHKAHDRYWSSKIFSVSTKAASRNHHKNVMRKIFSTIVRNFEEREIFVPLNFDKKCAKLHAKIAKGIFEADVFDVIKFHDYI